MGASWRGNLLTLHVLLLRRRKELGITQRELADKLLVSLPTFKRWESAHCEPSTKALWLWADTLGVSISASVEKVSLNDTREAV